MKKEIVMMIFLCVSLLVGCGNIQNKNESDFIVRAESKVFSEGERTTEQVEIQKEKLEIGYNVQDYGVSPEKVSDENGPALYELIRKVEENGGGTLYFPSGIYNIQNIDNYIIRTSNIRFLGDGASTVLVRWGTNSIFHVVGTSIRSEQSDGKRLSGIQIDDIYILSSQSYTEQLKPVMVFEGCSGIRINNVSVKGAGTHIEFVECFDSKIISTDFELSGRSFKEDETIQDDYIDYDNRKNDEHNPTIKFCSNVKSFEQRGYEQSGLKVETTNQIHFIGCRFESFYGGVAAVEGDGTNGISFTNCKFESMVSRVPFFTFRYSISAMTINNCFFCKYPEGPNGEDLSKVPVIYSDNIFMTNNVDINISIEPFNDLVMKTDLIRLNQIEDYDFGANSIKVRIKSCASNGQKLFNDGCYVVNSTYPEDLQLNGNSTEVYLYNSYGDGNVEYSALPDIMSPPDRGWHVVGERLKYTKPDVLGNTEAICVESGNPGKWILK